MREEKNHLYILWVNANPITSKNMVMMYSKNCILKGWWKEVTVIIWGDSARYISEDEEIRKEIKVAMQIGVKFSACKRCVENLDVKQKIQELGIDIIGWGEPLTEILKYNDPLLTV